MPKKLSRSQSLELAQAARRLPVGTVSDRTYLQLSSEMSLKLRKQSSINRGETYELGAAIEANGYLLLYDILDRLGVRIISTIVGDPLTIVCRHKTYEGSNQAKLLLEILHDRLENYNYLGLGEIEHGKNI